MSLLTIKILILVVLTLLNSLDTVLSTLNNSCNCSSITPAIAPDPLSLDKILKFFESQKVGAKLFHEYINTVEYTVVQAFTKHTTNKEDIHLPMESLVKKYGFQIKKYSVTTVDGYILGVFRIPNDGPPVLLVHGTCGSSEDYITAGPDDGMGYVLARAGYDVYFINARGNKFSKQHKELSTKCAEYWDFSFHEIGKYDLPATIDFILDLTGKEKISIIGWSQGTTSFFIMCSECPSYNDKVNLMVALSPVVFMAHCISPILRILALGEDTTYLFLNAVGRDEFLPSNVLTSSIVQIFCAPNPIAKIGCNSIISLMTGYDGCHSNVTMLPVEIGHNPSGCSTKQVIHYAQEVNSGKFQHFDYGKKKNKKVYGSDEPPEYALEKVTAPVALFYGTRDWLASITDVNILKKLLPNIVKDYCIDEYGHLDFVWGKDATPKVTHPILDLLKTYASIASSC